MVAGRRESGVSLRAASGVARAVRRRSAAQSGLRALDERRRGPACDQSQEWRQRLSVVARRIAPGVRQPRRPQRRARLPGQLRRSPLHPSQLQIQRHRMVRRSPLASLGRRRCRRRVEANHFRRRLGRHRPAMVARWHAHRVCLRPYRADARGQPQHRRVGHRARRWSADAHLRSRRSGLQPALVAGRPAHRIPWRRAGRRASPNLAGACGRRREVGASGQEPGHDSQRFVLERRWVAVVLCRRTSGHVSSVSRDGDKWRIRADHHRRARRAQRQP